MESQQTVINLQKQRLQEKSGIVSEIKEVVKAQLESYSSVASSGISSAAIEEEERSRNVVVFGLSEDSESEKRTGDLVAEV